MAGMALWSDGKIENEESYINWLKWLKSPMHL
jgi:hypothetical protein